MRIPSSHLRAFRQPHSMPANCLNSQRVKDLAAACGFEIAGAAPAAPLAEAAFFEHWAGQGMAGEMRYLTDHRAALRRDPRSLLPGAASVICVGKLYYAPPPESMPERFDSAAAGWISRYAWGEDYHDVLRRGLEKLAECLRAEVRGSFEYKVCVDTAPLLERALARRAGLGWIGKNTCLINQQSGSWFFLGELLTTLPLEPDQPPPDRCGTCTRCIDACPTHALVPAEFPGGPAWALDSRRCISYLTIELRSDIDEELRPGVGGHIFGCDICQDVCPWNRRAPVTSDPAFQPRTGAIPTCEPRLDTLATLTPDEFRGMFRNSPVHRVKYSGFLRNVAVAMGNSGNPALRDPLEKLAGHSDPLVARHAAQALDRLKE